MANLHRSAKHHVRADARLIGQVFRSVRKQGENNVPYFLEVNTFAGLNMPDENVEKTAHYGYMGYMAKERGYSRAQFMAKIVGSTIVRYHLEGKKSL